MTIVGKILVFVNLVFSLIVGGLVMVLFVTRTNWEEAYKKRDAQARAADADRSQAARQYDDDRKKSDDTIATLRTQLADTKKELDTAKTEIKDKDEALGKVTDADRNAAAQVTTLQALVATRTQQVGELEKAVQTLRDEKRQAIKERNDEIGARIQADVEARSAKARALDLEEQLREAQRDLIRIQTPTEALAGRKRGEENPPAENVEGRVTWVDSEDNLASLSIGSDAGLAVGHTLKVFRLHPVPEQSKYLGVLEIVAVRPHESVAKPLKPLIGRMQRGDRVASDLLGGN